MTKVELKAEIFDIVVEQEELQRKINDLHQLKKNKLQELQELQNNDNK